MRDPLRGGAGASPPDDAAIESQLGPVLVARLFGLLRAVRLYDLSNQAVRDQLRDLLEAVDRVMEDEVVLVAMGQCFYVNGVRIRAASSQVSLFDALTAEFDLRGLGGLRLLPGVDASELGNFLVLFSRRGDPEYGGLLPEACAAAGISRVVPVTKAELASLGQSLEQGAAENSPQHERERSLETHRRAVRGAKSLLLRTAKTGKPTVRRIKRVVQPIVDSVLNNEYSIVGLTAIKSHDEYTYVHCVNVSILAVAIGQCLGLSRAELANLGVAALLHDVGKLAVPAEVLGKPGKLSSHEWELMTRHPIEGTKMISRMPGLSSLTTDLLRVCLQHHVMCDGTGYPKSTRPHPPSTLSRIVSVADCFDAMTAHRAYRKRPFTGFEALGILMGPERDRFDPGALWALVRSVGLYPAGTMMLMRSGYRVLSLNADPENPVKPHCRVLSRPDGSMPLESEPEIWAPMPADDEVLRVIPPEEFDIGVDRLLAA